MMINKDSKSNSVLKGQIVEDLMSKFYGKSVCVNCIGGLSTLMHIKFFNCYIAGKNKKILVLSDEESEIEFNLFLDIRKIDEWFDDFICDTFTIQMKGDMVIEIYEG